MLGTAGGNKDELICDVFLLTTQGGAIISRPASIYIYQLGTDTQRYLEDLLGAMMISVK